MAAAVQPAAMSRSLAAASFRTSQARSEVPSSSKAAPLSTAKSHRRHVAFSASPRRSRTTPATAANAASSSSSSFGGEAEDPHQVLGLTPLDSFDRVKAAHRKKVREAEASGNEEALERVNRAYDKIMMQQLMRRQKGLTFGSVQVSQEVKYADDKGWFLWGPKPERSPKKTLLLNAAVSGLMAVWVVAAPTTDWKVLQILLSYYVFTLFMKLDPFYPPGQDAEEKPWARNGRRLTRSLSLVFGVVLAASVAHTVAYKAFSLFGYYVPRAMLTFQEMLITLACSAGMFVIGSYFR